MSLGIFSVYSHALGMDMPLNVLLPERRKAEAQDWSDKKFPVLYCLHGHSDDQNAWIRKSQIELLTRGYEVIVVMPTTHRGFYTDAKYGHRYFTYIAEELPQLVANMFHASTRREDTFVMGNSMGGYGAFKLALTYPERYAAAASLSGALDPFAWFSDPVSLESFVTEDFANNIHNVFGSAEEYHGSRNDLRYLARRLAASNGPQPLLYQCCGTDDNVTYCLNESFTRAVRQGLGNLNLQYEEGPGGHDWSYWMPQMERFISLLDLRPIS